MKVLRLIYAKCKTHTLTFFTIGSVIGGVVLGVVLYHLLEKPLHSRQIMYIGFLGEIFLQMLKGISLPLVGSCLLHAFSTFDREISGRIGIHFILFCVVQKILAAVLSTCLVFVIQPGFIRGKRSSSPGQTEHVNNVTSTDTLLDLVRNLSPTNLIEMCVCHYQTILEDPEDPTIPLEQWKIRAGGGCDEEMNMLGLVTLTIAFGFVLRRMDSTGLPVINIVAALTNISYKITHWMLVLAPIMLVSLISSQLVQVDCFSHLFIDIGYFIGNLLIAYVLQTFFVNSAIFMLVTRKNPFIVLYNSFDTMLAGMITMSSMMCIPVTIKRLEEKTDYDRRLIKFVIPIGHTINKDGVVVYLITAAIFIAQENAITLDVDEIFGVIIMSVCVSLALPAFPLADIIVLMLISDALSLPSNQIGMLISIEWFIEGFQTVCNCVADIFIVAMLQHLHQGKLEEKEIVIPSEVPDVESFYTVQRRRLFDTFDQTLPTAVSDTSV